MSQCQSIQDARGVQCNAGKHHASYMLHIWQGETEDGPNTVVLWNDYESRQFMDVEREFFRIAEDMTVDGTYPVPQYQTMIADLIIRLRTKEKNL